MRDSVLTTLRHFVRLSGAITMTAFAAGIAFAQTPEAPPVAPPMIGTGVLPRDLSPWGMFLNADIVVQLVMIGLVFAWLVTWTTCLVKSLALREAKKNARVARDFLKGARSLAEVHEKFRNQTDAVGKLVQQVMEEKQLSANSSDEGLKERVALLIERWEIDFSRRIGRGMGVLASIGATAPFVGLFGAVWGIMNSFTSISKMQTTSLAVVAPGIAEALLATAIGLFVAIPAVVIYNVFARQTGSYRALLADTGALVMRLLSRDCERSQVSLARAAE